MANRVIHIYTRASRAEIKEVVRSIPSAIAGTGKDPKRLHKGFVGRVAKSFFTNVWFEFTWKGHGSGGEDGKYWQENSPKHLAYTKGTKQDRRGPGQMPFNYKGGPEHYHLYGQLPPKTGKLGRGPGTGFLNTARLRRWRVKYVERRAIYRRMGIENEKRKKMAAQDAWIYIKSLGGKTKLNEFGEKRDVILNDSGKLHKSLEPGTLTDEHGFAGTYIKKRKTQLVNDRKTKFELGTKVEYAKYHHNDGQGTMPQRRLWPEELPDSWLQDITDSFTQQMIALAKSLER